MGDGYECWNDDWDNDGDGEPDWTDFYEECDELSDGGWECQTWHQDPSIEEGNHTMELTTEDLEVGSQLHLEISTDVCQNMVGCEHDYITFEFTATAETMSETFHLETDNYTCGVNIDVHLYEEMDWVEQPCGIRLLPLQRPLRAAPLAIHADIRRRRVRAVELPDLRRVRGHG